jgi:hypothetical protein
MENTREINKKDKNAHGTLIMTHHFELAKVEPFYNTGRP